MFSATPSERKRRRLDVGSVSFLLCTLTDKYEYLYLGSTTTWIEQLSHPTMNGASVLTLSSSSLHHPRPKEETEDDWAHFEDPDALEPSEEHSSFLPFEFAVNQLPPQLHPAISLGVQRVSSCYFSLGSERESSIADLLSQFGDDNVSVASENDHSSILHPYNENGAEVLYHDILMHVFTFLDAPSIAAFSETARRPNFEVFYFLQLQLQRALLVASQDKHDGMTQYSMYDSLAAIAGSSCLSRLAQLDKAQAQEVVEEYLQSNSTLRTMPLSHSLAYFRQALMQRNGFFQQKDKGERDTGQTPPTQALASAALLVTMVGAAVMTGSADTATLADSFGGELPNMLFRVGFVGSALMATRQMATNELEPNTMRERAERMARALQDLPAAFLRQEMPEHFRLPSLVELRQSLYTTISGNSDSPKTFKNHNGAISSNPYDHLPAVDEKKEDDDAIEHPRQHQVVPKVPSGSVGAYSRAVQKAACAITTLTKERRRLRFQALSPIEQRSFSLTFLDACSSDENLPIIKEMIHSMDVDGFFVGSDGSETCALHTAAFHGASEVVDFLCRGIDYGDSMDEGCCAVFEDGGLCEINATDSNGWTALHFAAGANAVSASKVLASYGAQLTVEANNGYTPLQWAQRLSNDSVAEALKELMLEKGANTTTWLPSRPLSQIANRFFSLIPSP